MFLKSLTLNGFKAFSQKTRIEFKEGIGAFLGPNGCGKSNLIDAIKWVLGEQQPSEFRAKKMEDIIFSGSQTKKKINMAEVELTILNENSLLPSEYNEISITRRLFRFGDSEYLINSKSVRLKDIQDLFSNTTISTTAIVEQGQIDQILSKSHEERRKMFEQVASVHKYKTRKKHYEKELLKTMSNLTRLNDLSRELKRQHDILEIQSQKAEKYLILKEDLKKFQIKKMLYQWIKKKNELEEIEKIKLTLNSQLLRQKEKVEMEKKLFDEFNQSSMGIKDELLKIEKDLSKQIQMSQSLISQGTLTEEREKNIHKSISSKEKELELFKKEIEEHHAKMKNLDLEIDAHKNDQIQNEAAIALKLKELESLKKELDDDTNELNAHQDKKRMTAKRIEEIRAHYKKIIDNLINNIDNLKTKADEQQIILSKKKEELLSLLEQLQISTEEFLREYNKEDSSKENSTKYLEGIQKSLRLLNEDFLIFIDNKNDLYKLLFSSEGIYSEKEKVDNELMTLSKSRETLDEEIEVILKKIKNNQEKMTRLNQEKKELEMRNSFLKEKQRYTEQSKKERTSSINNLSVKREKTLQLIEQEQAALVKHQEKLKEISKNIRESKERENKLKLDLEVVKTGFQKRGSELEKKRASLYKEEKQLELFKEASQKKEIESKLLYKDIEMIEQKALNEYSEDVRTYEKHSEKSFDLNHIETSIQQLSKAINELGASNFLAKDELEEIKKKIDKQETQKKDVLASIDNLEKLVKELDVNSSQVFLDTFYKVEKNFHSIFRRLFNGGQAKLELSNPQDPLNCDIDILIQPPGKKLQHLSLLSGGEKSLIATALILSMFLVKPSPFCLLDEIDAALDKNSIAKLSKLLEDFKEESQFVIISHNEKMVSSVDYVYGVTMNDGESTVISLDFSPSH